MKKHVLTLVLVAILAVTGQAIAQDFTAGNWTVVPLNDSTTVIVGPDGKHHVVTNMGQRSYGYGTQPGWTQYPNPVDGFFQSFQRGQAWRRSLSGGE